MNRFQTNIMLGSAIRRPGSPANSRLKRAYFSGGFTVFELLVVCSLATVLLGIVLPAIQQARESARRIQCVSNLKQIGLALQMAHDQETELPAGWHAIPETRTAWSWACRVLPFLDQPGLYSSIHWDQPVTHEQHHSVCTAPLSVMVCPSDLVPATFRLYAETEKSLAAAMFADTEPLAELPSTNYVGVFGDADPDVVAGHTGSGTFLEDRQIGWKDLSQGLSHVMIVSERTAAKLPSTWLAVDTNGEDAPARMTGFAFLGPNHVNSDECEFASRHPGLINALFADGHVSQVADSVDSLVYRQSARRDAVRP